MVAFSNIDEMEERSPPGDSRSTDTPIRQYIWGNYIDELIQLTTLTTLGSQNVPAGTYYLLQDLLYRAVALTNSTGSIVEAYDTDACAQTIIYTGPGPDGVWLTDDDTGSGFTYGANDIIFCGYPDNKRVSTDIGTGLNDPEAELYYVRNRSYNPTLGRWLQRDPIGYAGGINLYDYVGGRAVTEVDSDGTIAIPVPKSALEAVVEAILAAILAAYLLHLARQAAEEKCENEKPKCKPCIPPVGTVGYLWHIVPPAKPHWPFPGDHLNLFDMQQSPSPICRCFWHRDGTVAPPPKPGWVPLVPALGACPSNVFQPPSKFSAFSFMAA